MTIEENHNSESSGRKQFVEAFLVRFSIDMCDCHRVTVVLGMAAGGFETWFHTHLISLYMAKNKRVNMANQFSHY